MGKIFTAPKINELWWWRVCNAHVRSVCLWYQLVDLVVDSFPSEVSTRTTRNAHRDPFQMCYKHLYFIAFNYYVLIS